MSHPPDKPKKPGGLDSALMGFSAPMPGSAGKNLAAQMLGQKGGLARAEKMSPERRSEIARTAAKRRWQKGSSE